MHGMGNLEKPDFEADIAKLRQKLATRLSAERIAEIYIPPSGIFYSDITQHQEDTAWEAMQSKGGLNTGWLRRNTVNKIRRFIVSGFSDATAFSGVNESGTQTPYRDAQQTIYAALMDVHRMCGDVPVFILSQSLGCQIMSNYLWDAQIYWRNKQSNTSLVIDERSIWATHTPDPIVPDVFLTLQSLKTWTTTGCNIPIFVSGFKDVRAVINNDYGYNFNWMNYFDYDDVLGYPMAPLSALFDPDNAKINRHGQSYANVVTDIQVNANDGIFGALFESWNPMSHTQYWGDSTVLDALAGMLK